MDALQFLQIAIFTIAKKKSSATLEETRTSHHVYRGIGLARVPSSPTWNTKAQSRKIVVSHIPHKAMGGFATLDGGWELFDMFGPALKLGDPRLRSRNLGRSRLDQRNQLVTT
jgi:hypothetical protein